MIDLFTVPDALDAGTLRDVHEELRRAGGELVFHGPYLGPTLRVPVAPPPGTLVAFRAETTHGVLPVTHGERFTVASWFRAPP